jgi:hypothetical protein
VELKPIRSVIGLLSQRDDFIHNLWRGLLGMREGLSGTFLQRPYIEVGLFEAIKPVEDPALGVGSKSKTSGNPVFDRPSLCCGI